MIDVSKVAYNVYAVLQDGTRLNVTPAVTDLGWEEGEGELSAGFRSRSPTWTITGTRFPRP